MTKKNAKLLLLEKGAEIVLQKGYNHTGIQEILKAAGIPKGSFYFYFTNKEDFGLQLIDYYARGIDMVMDNCFADKGISPVNRLKRFFETLIMHQKEKNFKGGCPIGNIAQEMGDINDSFGVAINSVFYRMRDKIGYCIKEAQGVGEMTDNFDPFEMADFIINSLEGALLRMKVVKSTEPLDLHCKIILEYLLAK